MTKNACLIVVDYQNDFVDGALGFEGAEAIGKTIRDKIRAYHEAGQTVLFTMDTHDDAYLESEEGKNLPVEHCIKGTKGHELHPSIKDEKTSQDLVFEKNTFPSLELGNYLKSTHYETIELVGLVSSICVLSNAIIAKSALPNARIIVDAKGTAGPDRALHEKTLDVMENLHIHITNRSD
ncbi:MAG: cysteine hydrolase family protein [Bacillota bacterium]